MADQNKEQGAKRDEFVGRIKVGDLIAFKLLANTEKLISGKVKVVNVRKESTDYEVETKNGTSYRVPRQNISWVNTGGRWPKGVIEAFRLRLDDEQFSSEEVEADDGTKSRSTKQRCEKET